MALPQVKQDATNARLSALSLPEGAGWVTAAREDALARQARVDARLGDILVADGTIDRPLLHAAIAGQFGAALANLTEEPPDPVLVAMLGADTCLSLGLLPWRRTASAMSALMWNAAVPAGQ